MHIRLTGNRAVLLFCIYAVLIFNVGFWQATWQKSLSAAGHDWLLLATMPLFVLAAMNFVMQLLFWPKVHRVLIPLLLVLSAGASYAVMTQNIYFNSDMIQNLLQTNKAEATAWLQVKFIGWVLLTGVLPAVWYARCVTISRASVWYKGLGWRGLSMLASVLVVAAVAVVGYQNYASFFRNNKGINHQIVPTNFIGASAKTVYNIYDASRPFEHIATDAKRDAPAHERKRLLVLVVGETTRAQNWGLNPGAPDTTPELKKMADVINYPNVSSCGTATAISVPCMFSQMSRSDYNGNRASHQEGLLDVLQRVGLYTGWRENDGGCKGVCDRIKHIDVRELAEKSQCGSEGCLDMVLLKGLAQEIQAMPTDGVIVLHTMGSHGPAYYQRYTDDLRKFTSTCDTNQIQDCNQEALRNTYNNTVLYIDHMLAATINLLRQQENTDTALWYVSDHGESLGENGMYLHAAPYAVAPKEQTHVPMIFWASENWYRHTGVSAACMKQSADKAYSHDNWFHSVLGINDVHTQAYQRDLDIFAACRS